MADKNALLTQCILDRLVRIESKVDRIVAHHTSPHTATHSGAEATLRHLMGGKADELLVGWAEISRFARKAPSTLRGYVRTMHFPAYRWGRFVVSHPQLILNWLEAVRRAKDQSRRKHP